MDSSERAALAADRVRLRDELGELIERSVQRESARFLELDRKGEVPWHSQSMQYREGYRRIADDVLDHLENR